MSSTKISSAAKNAAKKLFNRSKSLKEPGISHLMTNLLSCLGLDEHLVEFRTDAGSADIYMQRRRVFIELKTSGEYIKDPFKPQSHRNDKKSAYDQVCGYLFAERNDELARIPDNKQDDMEWVAIVTDGWTWLEWRFAHKAVRHAKEAPETHTATSVDDLIAIVQYLLDREAVGKVWIPSNPISVFDGMLEELRKIHDTLPDRAQEPTEMKRILWLDALTGSGMAPESSSAEIPLFTAHSFLVALARGVVHTILKPGDTPCPCEILGEGYPAWIVEEERGRVWAQQLFDKIHGYEWRRRPGDVLRPLYEEFVDASDRHKFGEIYTPDWLAEMMVEEVLDENWCNESIKAVRNARHTSDKLDGIGVLDPTCGSGTFLYHCVKRILRCDAIKGLQPTRQADAVCRLVFGIDIHPVAVEFCKATLMRALPSTPETGHLALAIYQGDSLMSRQMQKGTLFEMADDGAKITLKDGTEIRIPRAFSEHTDFHDMMRRLVNDAKNDEKLSHDIFLATDEGDSVRELHRTLTEVIKVKDDSVWTWYITNVLGPERMSRSKVNRVVANPPWVTMSTIQEADRKDDMELLAGKDGKAGNLNLWPGGRHAGTLDLAQLFVKRTRETYLKSPNEDPAAWVVKVSALEGGNWEKFRLWHQDYLMHALDLEKVKVFQGSGDARKCCVLFENRRSSIRDETNDEKAPLLQATCPKKPPDANMSWSDASELIKWVKPKQFPKEPSQYDENQWNSGASLYPRVLSMIDRDKIEFGKKETRKVTTVKSAKRKWKDIATRTGDIPAHWLAPVLTPHHLLPFHIDPRGPCKYIVPQDHDGNLLATEEARQSEFWTVLDDLYRAHKGIGENTPDTLIKQINHNGKLSAQLPLRPSDGYIVIYPASGNIMRATFIKEGEAIMDTGIYRRPVENVMEARFLVAILNAPALREAFEKLSGSSRHFHKTPWRCVPIPKWDKANGVHRELADLAQRAEKTACAMENLSGGQQKMSKTIRGKLNDDGTFDSIDRLVRQIFPKHAE